MLGINISVSIGAKKIVQPSGPPLWTPAEITTEAWYDAKDSDTINTTGTDITSILDKSGQDNTLTPVGINDAPQYGTDKISLSYTHKSLNTASSVLTNSYDIVCVATVNGSTLPSDKAVLGSQGTGTADGRFSLVINAPLGGAIITEARPEFPLAIGSWTTPDFGMAGFGASKNAQTRIDLYKNAVSIANTTSNIPATIIDDDFVVGSIDGPDTSADGTWDLHELVVINSYDATNRQLVEGYMFWRWGIQAKLPVGHPYKDAAPTI